MWREVELTTGELEMFKDNKVKTYPEFFMVFFAMYGFIAFCVNLYGAL